MQRKEQSKMRDIFSVKDIILDKKYLDLVQDFLLLFRCLSLLIFGCFSSGTQTTVVYPCLLP